MSTLMAISQTCVSSDLPFLAYIGTRELPLCYRVLFFAWSTFTILIEYWRLTGRQTFRQTHDDGTGALIIRQLAVVCPMCQLYVGCRPSSTFVTAASDSQQCISQWQSHWNSPFNLCLPLSVDWLIVGGDVCLDGEWDWLWKWRSTE